MNMPRYGYLDDVWDSAKTNIRGILIEIARARGTIYYSELSNRMQPVQIPYWSYAMGGILGEISREESNAGRPMLSAVVINRKDNTSGKGFIKLARRLGRTGHTDYQIWETERNNVWNSLL